MICVLIILAVLVIVVLFGVPAEKTWTNINGVCSDTSKRGSCAGPAVKNTQETDTPKALNHAALWGHNR